MQPYQTGWEQHETRPGHLGVPTAEALCAAVTTVGMGGVLTDVPALKS